MKDHDHIDAYLDSRSRIYNFLGSIAENYPEDTDENAIIRFACHAILFCHSDYSRFKDFLKKIPLTNKEKNFFDKIGINLDQ